MDGQNEVAFAALLFVGLFLDWAKALASAVFAVFVRSSTASVILAAAVGAILGLVGARLELLDLYLTRDGWAALDVLTALQVTMSALASMAWWGIARACSALVRHILR